MVKTVLHSDQDEAALEQCLGFVDFYGAIKFHRQPENRSFCPLFGCRFACFDPTGRPKSRSGAIISTIARIVILVLIILVILKFAEIERGHLDGEQAILNPRTGIPDYEV